MKEHAYQIAAIQPFSGNLKPLLPVNFFLFVKYGDRDKTVIKKVKSNYHGTNDYKLIPFYKSVSNII
ncbi:MAG: hypothetical protein O9353_01755 [Bacteroidia bacterium]|nr:hypothetical protein [Bacteroidia bacterium]